MRYVKPLSMIRLADAREVGGKAAVLGELLGAGFRVPAGFAIAAAALADVAGPPGGRSEPAAPPPLSPELTAELRVALAELGTGPVAVRSSAAGEDGARASFAGLYESVLNVEGFDSIVAAVRRCSSSADGERVAAYWQGGSPAGPIGVLVQAMVPADAAGAAFSINPVTADPAERRVSAVKGLGDRLMAGQLTAEEWAARDDAVELLSGAQDALDEARVREIVKLTERVAAYFGEPQDIEWAIAGQDLWLLQARPVTALPGDRAMTKRPAIDVPPGFWARGPGSDRPSTPMQRSVYLPVLTEHLGQMFAFSVIGPPRVREIGGWVYLNMGGAGEDGSLPTRAERIGAAITAREPELAIERWQAEWKPAFAARIAALRDVDLTGLPDERLQAHLRELTGVFAELHAIYFRLTGASSFIFGRLGLACQELLGWSPQETARLRGGLRGDHMAAIVTLADLARMAARRPAVRTALENADTGTAGRLAEVDPAFASAFASYCHAYAHRTGGFDLTQPTLAEQPAVLLSLVRAQLDSPFDLAAEQTALDDRVSAAVSQAEAVLSTRSTEDRDRFRAALAANDAGTGVRDEKVFYAVSAWALVRYAALETGRRLADRNLLARAEDVLFLAADEALAALRTRSDQTALVRRRRTEHAWASSHPGPPSYGTPPAGPPVTDEDLAPLSHAARTAVLTSLWVASMWAAKPAGQASGDAVVRGTAASAGRYTGPVRVVRDITEFGKIRRGDVLVCPETTAQWSVLFPSIGALVADRGGLLSHPAIIAREYGLPAVVAAATATSMLHDDQVVTVDGTAGTVQPVTGASRGS